MHDDPLTEKQKQRWEMLGVALQVIYGLFMLGFFIAMIVYGIGYALGEPWGQNIQYYG